MHPGAGMMALRVALRRVREERGAALVTALMVSMVVVILGTTAIGIAVHNTEASGNDRRRVQAVAAAESGVDFYFAQIQGTTNMTSLPCSINRTLATSPPSFFTVTATFQTAAGAAMACPLTTTVPASVLLTSVGKAGPATPRRTMQAQVKLTTAAGSSYGEGAIFGNTGLSFTANSQIGGSQFNDADVYTNGNITMGSNSVIYGNVYAQGTASMSTGTDIRRNLWANGAIAMAGSAAVRGNVTSSASTLTMSQTSRVYGNARAGGAITTNNSSRIDGTRSPNSPSDPPPARPFPVFNFNPSEWQEQGYTVTSFSDCTQARTFIQGIASGNHAVRITSTCAMTVNTNVTVRGHLAIIADGPITLNTGIRFNAAAGTGPHRLFLVAGLAKSGFCNFTANPNSGVGTNIDVFLYSPCTVDLSSNSAFTRGQVFGDVVNVKHSIAFQYALVPVPGGTVGGFKQDVLFKREVVTS
ncbi:MAG: pilus assembly PilX N-terminal domain-containing protein [Actinomycetota bacterium]|nr:pilus assembly PilX N-terminal domain-containing protein [Actinomycetota bacterium]